MISPKFLSTSSKQGILFCLLLIFTLGSHSQELDPDFLKSLPGPLADTIKDSAADNDTDLRFKGDSSQLKNKELLKELETKIDRLRDMIEDENKDQSVDLEIYGTQFFRSFQTTFSPINLANPDNSYILDYGDTLSIQLEGSSSDIDEVIVQRDGSIQIEGVGKINIAGLSLSQATSRIEESVSQAQLGLRAFVSLAEIKDIQILITGEVYNPGIYTLSGNSNILHAINVSGGISENGSFRKIIHKRNRKIINIVDLYQIFLFGNLNLNTDLMSGDVLMIESRGKLIPIRGGVNREYLFEINANETLEDIINFAGGFSDSYDDTQNIIVSSLSENTFKSTPINYQDAGSILLKPRDTVYIPMYKFIDDNEFIKVEITGEVNKPGSYLLKKGSTLSDLIANAGGYKINAYQIGGILQRKGSIDLETEYLKRNYRDTINYIASTINAPNTTPATKGSVDIILEELKSQEPSGRIVVEFDVNKIKQNPALDTFLHDGDTIFIPFMPEQVFVFGEFNQTGSLTYDPAKSLKDYFDMSGSLKESSLDNIIIIHPNGSAKIFNTKSFSIFSNNEPLLLPGTILYAPKEIGEVDGVRYAALIAPIISSLALSLASLNSIN